MYVIEARGKFSPAFYVGTAQHYTQDVRTARKFTAAGDAAVQVEVERAKAPGFRYAIVTIPDPDPLASDEVVTAWFTLQRAGE